MLAKVVFPNVVVAIVFPENIILGKQTRRAVRHGRQHSSGRFTQRFICGIRAPGRFGEVAPRSRDREALIVEEALDLANGFHVFAAIQAMSLGAFYRLQRREFSLPVAQDEGFGAGETAHLADAEKAPGGARFRTAVCAGRVFVWGILRHFALS